MGWIQSLVNRIIGVENTPMPPAGSVVQDLALYEQHVRIGGGLTPKQVSAYFYQADTGNIRNLVCLANDSRQKDGHLHSVLQTREMGVSILPIEVKPYIAPGLEEPSEIDSEIAGFVEYTLQKANGYDQEIRALEDMIEHMAGGVFFGHATSEIMWDVSEGKLVPIGFKNLDQRRFEFSQTNGRLMFDDGWYGSNAVDLQARFPGKFLVNMPRVTGDIACREGLYHILIWFALFRNWAFADWLKLAEMAWKPWRIGKYSIKAGEDDKDNLLAVMRGLTSNGIAVIREDQNVDVRWPSAQGTGATEAAHGGLCTFFGSEISKAVLGQTLTTEQGTRGARSLGEIHNAVRLDIRLKDARAIGRVLERDLIRFLVLFNYGEKARVPEVCLQAQSGVDVEMFSNAVNRLADANADIPVSWVHENLGIHRVDDEPVIGANNVTDAVQDNPA